MFGEIQDFSSQPLPVFPLAVCPSLSPCTGEASPWSTGQCISARCCLACIVDLGVRRSCPRHRLNFHDPMTPFVQVGLSFYPTPERKVAIKRKWKLCRDLQNGDEKQKQSPDMFFWETKYTRGWGAERHGFVCLTYEARTLLEVSKIEQRKVGWGETEPAVCLAHLWGWGFGICRWFGLQGDKQAESRAWGSWRKLLVSSITAAKNI